MKTRDEAFALLTEHTKSESLIKHAIAVEAAMRWYAQHFSEDEELWGITGLLHDFDNEQYPNLDKDGHPFVGCKILEDLGYSNLIIEAILGHATYSGVDRKTNLAKVLFASDELCGLIYAATLVRPDRSLHSLSVKSLKKKMKDKSFARTINRDDIILGTEELGIEISQHIQNVIEGMKSVAHTLGINGAT